ncbi:MAG: energy transducer TonB [Deltaproteobacteria bacterium]|nr:energy transducer TonB [Deltaproteobacteria bacterium]
MSKLAALCLAIVGSVLLSVAARAGDEPAVRGEGPALPYLEAVHAKVHPLWADNFLVLAASQLPKDHAINDVSRRVELAVVVASKGALVDVKVAKTSGSSDFDTSAMEVVRAAGNFAAAPEEVLSDDGKVHLRWAFARDDRRCSELAVTHRELPVPEAVRNMVAQGRDDAAIARLQSAKDEERTAGMDVFARAWLDRVADEKDLELDVALANALAGDARGAEQLRRAATAADAPESVAQAAARGLAALKIPVCPLVKQSLARAASEDKKTPASQGTETSDDQLARGIAAPQARDRVLRLLREGADGSCLGFGIATAKDRAAKKDHRLLAVSSLERSEGAEAKTTLRALAKDPDPAISAAAILAEARPGAGRGAVFRLIPLLRHKSVAVRAAAATALVRVGGEAALSQLFLVHKEKDPNVYAMLAAELSKLSGSASAEMLGRFLRKDNPEIRLAAARALAARRDERAVKLQATLATAERPELRLLAGLSLDKDKRDRAMRELGDIDFGDSYSALLRGKGRIVAADWLLARFSELPPAARVDLLGRWLAARPEDK